MKELLKQFSNSDPTEWWPNYKKIVLLPLIKKFFIPMGMYALTSYLYLIFYDHHGFEKTIVVLIAGVIIFAIRSKS